MVSCIQIYISNKMKYSTEQIRTRTIRLVLLYNQFYPPNIQEVVIGYDRNNHQ